MIRKYNRLLGKNQQLQQSHDKQESYSRRENLLIRGTKEQPEETEKMCKDAVRQLLISEMNINDDKVKKMVLVGVIALVNDSAAEEKILCVDNPGEAKRIIGDVKNFNKKDWDNRKKKIMLDILKIKFKVDSDEAKLLKDTDGKSLAEAGKSKVFAVGITLNNRNIMDISKWSKDGNLLGKCLMEIRNELLH